MTKITSLLKTLGLNLLICYLLTEITCLIFIKSGYIPAKLPTFHLRVTEIAPIADMNPDWGVWHPSNTISSVGIGDCFNVTYSINSYGARDKERKVNGTTDRIIILGDSFMEGLGVEASERVSDILEQKLHKEFLNFACSGNFGPLQSYLVYEKLASGFSHNEVWLFLLPDNDFNDDDYESGLKTWYYRHRYKPYLVGKYPDYKLKYMQNKIEDSYFTQAKIEKEKWSFNNTIHQSLKSYTYWYNILTFYKQKKVGLELSRVSGYSGYYDYTQNQIDNLKYVVKKLKSKTGKNQLKIFLIPAINDFARYGSEGGKGETKLGKELGKILNQDSVVLYDLLPEFYQEHNKDFTNYYISCDKHWNKLGHQYIASLLIKKNHKGAI